MKLTFEVSDGQLVLKDVESGDATVLGTTKNLGAWDALAAAPRKLGRPAGSKNKTNKRRRRK